MASETSVLVVGGGPVGLTLSCLLSAQRVDNVLVEAHRATSPHPKARGVSARSMEIFRRIGIEEEVRKAGLPAEHVSFYRGRDLVDPDFVRTGLVPQRDENDRGDQDGDGDSSDERTPSPGLLCSQDALEPVLLRHATEPTGRRIRFGTRLLSFAEDDEGVLAVVEAVDTGERHRIRADWLVGCDGAASAVRAGAGIAMEGPTGLGRYLSIRFEAPLGHVVADRASASYFLTTPGRGGFLAVDNDRHWIYQHPLAAGEAEPAGDPAGPADPADRPRLAELIRTAAGIPDLEVTVRDTSTWRMDAQLAADYRRSRVLLAGDAAHVIPPTGGHGMNTGIGDADNLAWKLAAVTAGHAGAALLDSYAAERRPIARQVIDVSADNARNRGSYRIDDELLLTAVYRSDAVAPEPGATPGHSALSVDGYRPACRPGARLPHVRLADGRSSLDLVGPGFTLLTAAEGPAWRRRAESAGRSGIPVTPRPLDREADPARWTRLTGQGDTTAAVLVRPDGHVAWCGTRTVTDLQAVLRRIVAS
ncbi:FAD-dependent monooxygenase [Streptacidiphilus melanogenes]|uniref:FAD-dependent monooxygenase n=1 Tax=Streptacidiphilus melanogenes TaxID=411235 RepID=UPI001364A805|nr:FAD-dependent monooxygenase [Streptacidiphilus melanogenes]